MNPQDYNQPAQPPQPSVPPNHPLSVMQPGEQVICDIKRHPIGLIGVYVVCGILLIAMALFVFVGLPGVFQATPGIALFGTLAFIVMAICILIFAFAMNVIYWGNRWIVTSDSVTQVSQPSLFSKQSSQLSLDNLEDVSSEKNGFLAHLFNVGLLKVETAGEHSKFIFKYCPNPDYYAQKILAAREQFEAAKAPALQQPQQPAPPTASPAPQDIPYVNPPSGGPQY